MVSLTRMDPSEVPADALRTRTTVDHSEYASALNGVQIGEWYQVPLEGVNRRALIRRLNQAASERAEDQGGPVKLRWAQEKHTKEGVAMFKAVAINSAEANEPDADGEGDSETENGSDTPARGRRARRSAEASAEPELVGSGA
jgi:hypothetical protein